MFKKIKGKQCVLAQGRSKMIFFQAVRRNREIQYHSNYTIQVNNAKRKVLASVVSYQ